VKSARLKGPFGAFGVIAGLAAASVFLPDGCRIDEAASLRLRLGVPLLAPLVFVGLGAWLARRRRAPAAMGLGLLASLLFSAGIGVLYGGPKGVLLTHIAALTVAPLLGAAVILAPLALAWLRRAHASRALPSGADHAVVWSFVAAAVNVGAGLFFVLSSRTPFDLRLAGAACAGACAMTLVALASMMRTFRASSALSALPLAPPTSTAVPLMAPLSEAAHVTDWGVGEARRDATDENGAGPFRAGVGAVWLGDRDEALRRVRQDCGIAVVALLLALLGAAASIASVSSAPPWKPPSEAEPSAPISLFGGC
jgi:hypothetical protein